MSLKNLPLHWKIILGMFLGILFGFLMSNFDQTGKDIISDWIKPFGTIFINALKLIAIPLILASLIKGISDLKDISKLSKMGGITITTYLITTIIAVSVGLAIVNVVKPGNSISDETRIELLNAYEGDADKKREAAAETKNSGPLQPIIDIVPSNIISAATDNKNMLQIIFFSILFGISMILIPEKKSKPLKDFFDSLNEVILKIIDLIMSFAPFGVFALLATLIVEAPKWDLLKSLLLYSITLIIGLFSLIIIYTIAVRLILNKSPNFFFKGILPAQLVAFSTSSSAATLPVTMDRVHNNLKVKKEVSSFVLPIGATINMDGTALYQGVAALFIAQLYGVDLGFNELLTIVLTATLASIGTAGVPGVGLIMLVIVLESIGLSSEIMAAGLAIIFGVDRILDMCRTTVNVSGDCMVAVIVDHFEQQSKVT